MKSPSPALRIEIRLPDGSWTRVNDLRPSDPSGSMSDNLVNGQRHVIVFGCLGDSSIVVRMMRAEDIEPTPFLRIVENNSEGERLATLTDGQSFQITVHSDVSRIPRTIRFTHRND